MIAQLTGKIARAGAAYLVLDVQGVGYKVSVPLSVLESAPPIGETLSLVIHTQVREDDISLFGFTDDTELRAFELLLTVSGVGPKVALGLLSALPVTDLAMAITDDDARTLTRVPGVGAKTAQRMILELRDKFAALGFERNLLNAAAQQATGAKKKTETQVRVEDVISALLNLGYNKAEAQRATDTALVEKAEEGSPPPEFAVLLRAALNRLTGTK